MRPVRVCGVALVSDVEEESVVSEVEDVVERDCEFDDAEVWREVAAGHSDLVDDGGADVLRELCEAFDGERLEVCG